MIFLPQDLELDLWEAKWDDCESSLAEHLHTPVKALPHADQDYFPNIHTLMLIMVTLPITSCECERSVFYSWSNPPYIQL